MGFTTYWILFALISVFIFHLLVMTVTIFNEFVFVFMTPAKKQIYMTYTQPPVYWLALAFSSFWAFQLMGMSFSANPHFYIFKVSDTQISKKVLELKTQITSVNDLLENIDNINLVEFKEISEKAITTIEDATEIIDELNNVVSHNNERKQAQIKTHNEIIKKMEAEKDILNKKIERLNTKNRKLYADLNKDLKENVDLMDSILDVVKGIFIGILASLLATIIVIKLKSFFKAKKMDSAA